MAKGAAPAAAEAKAKATLKRPAAAAAGDGGGEKTRKQVYNTAWTRARDAAINEGFTVPEAKAKGREAADAALKAAGFR